MAREQDPYDVLGLGRHASSSDVARAYRRAARATHPDSSAGAASAERFQEVSDAYETLRDPQRRAAHDRARAERPSVVSVGRHIVLGAPQGLNAVRRGLFIEVKKANDH